MTLQETKGRSLEDINAQFGEQVAIHYYGATEQEKQELEKAAAEDEIKHGDGHAVQEKAGVVERVEHA